MASTASAMSATFLPETLLTWGRATMPYSRWAWLHPPWLEKQFTMP